MANSILFKEKKLAVGDMITVDYKIKEGEKFRIQSFQGILLKIGGSTPENKMITVRKISKTGIGVERIIPLISPFIDTISVDKVSNYQKSKLYFIRELSNQQLRNKLFSQKKAQRKVQKKA
ncbi:50S ribosomal protein L19 [Candidatus Roizmanbacteria bacterium]|nr:50S ribosomal protein L19 [Candidatus Roizmanbacteria bacterium]